MSTSDIAVSFDNVVKQYRLGQERTNMRSALPGRFGSNLRGDVHTALDDVSFTIPLGGSFGFIGHNGAGKSTLLKLVAGVISPTTGRVHVSGRVAALIELGAGLHPDMTGSENIRFLAAVLGMGRRDLQSRIDEITAFAEIDSFLDTPVKRYSSGMLARLGFAVASHLDADILVLDEVLAVGDAAFQRRCHRRVLELRQSGCTTLYVTHALWTLPILCERAALLDHGRVVAEGAPHEALRAYRSTQSQGPDAPDESHRITLRLLEKEIPVHGAFQAVVDLLVPDLARDPRLFINISDEGGEVVSGWSSAGNVALVPGERQSIRFSCPTLPLRPGQYLFNVGLTHDDNDIVIEDFTREEFNITGPATHRETFGVLSVPAEWHGPTLGGDDA